MASAQNCAAHPPEERRDTTAEVSPRSRGSTGSPRIAVQGVQFWPITTDYPPAVSASPVTMSQRQS